MQKKKKEKKGEGGGFSTKQRRYVPKRVVVVLVRRYEWVTATTTTTTSNYYHTTGRAGKGKQSNDPVFRNNRKFISAAFVVWFPPMRLRPPSFLNFTFSMDLKEAV